MVTGYRLDYVGTDGYFVNVHVSPVLENSILYNPSKKIDNMDGYITSVVVSHFSHFDDNISADIHSDNKTRVYDSLHDVDVYVKTLMKNKRLDIYILTKKEKKQFDNALSSKNNLNLGWIFLTLV